MRTKLRNSEEVLLKTHHHWLTMAKPILAVFITGLATCLMYALSEEMNTFFYVWVSLSGFAIAFLYATYRWYDWSVNLWAVTNYRVIEEAGVFSILAKESPLDKINNISYQQSFFGRMWGYGDVEIQTAAGEGMTIHRFIDDPKELKDTINEAKDRLLITKASTTSNYSNSNHSSSNNQKAAIAEAQSELSNSSDQTNVADIIVNLYQKTDMEIAQIATMVNKDKTYVIEVLMDRRMLDKERG
ncbi:MAG: PH domain-containing protein [Chitinophagales bacterium]